MAMAERPVAIVTGAASGIGRALSLALARQGVAIGAVDVNERGAIALAEAIHTDGGWALPFGRDIACEHALVDVAHTLLREAGRVDRLYNVAGLEVNGDVLAVDAARWRAALAVAALAHRRARPEPRRDLLLRQLRGAVRRAVDGRRGRGPAGVPGIRPGTARAVHGSHACSAAHGGNPSSARAVSLVVARSSAGTAWAGTIGACRRLAGRQCDDDRGGRIGGARSGRGRLRFAGGDSGPGDQCR